MKWMQNINVAELYKRDMQKQYQKKLYSIDTASTYFEADKQVTLIYQRSDHVKNIK